MDYALFLGCTVPARSLGYDLSVRKVAETLDVNLVDVEGFSCCGFPTASIHRDTSFAMAAINLCLAEEKNLDIITLCNSCTAYLTKVNMVLKNDKEMFDKVNDILKSNDLEFRGTIDVKHISRLLYEDIGTVKIQKNVKRDLNGLTIAPIYGCHYLKPSSIYNNFDDPEMPKSLDSLISATGATSLDFPEKILCCGGAILAIDENASMGMTHIVLDSVKSLEADAMVTICPFCHIMYDEYQPTIGNKYGKDYNIPTLLFTQLLGLAFGYNPKELGMKFNAVKTKDLVKRITGGEQ
ncbi:MAG: CoB--CoM heterodisulfide reductase iron-sulfur subunit B family protein [Thermoplasmata archaeon]|nr:MAG: CoB--CoM heterodisulfide reductase iron-sulfur subunit B family protein [Thermoplasmata archaeon]